MAGISRSLGWRHVLVASSSSPGRCWRWRGWLGQPFRPERFDAKQVVVTPVGDDGLRIREVVDQDFGSFQRHGYERRIPNDYGVPVDVEASSPDAPADVSVVPDPERANWTRIRVGDPGRHRRRAAPLRPRATRSPTTRVGDGRAVARHHRHATRRWRPESFEVVVAGMELEDPECRTTRRRVRARARRRRLPRRDRPARRRRRASRSTGPSSAGSRRRRSTCPRCPSGAATRDSTVPLAAVLLPIGARRCGGVYAFARRRGRNDVYAGGAADAAFGPGSLPPPGSPPLAVTQGRRRPHGRPRDDRVRAATRRRAVDRARCCCASGSTPTPSAPGSPGTPPATS